ncbi:GNAT family N-acetyltransferase [Chryseobacterium sp. Leaf394]|uniref:GNAT family N-acetyltransferase n=1 Tax=Chryseobacterium sp. Leaf394 TaxID=1736361 RepID=UPI0007004792|nr:GNAT family N-acetyltransferase [Chryseobacterium sp. Leaf394]KQS92509.1 GCN5 family acetyltransferase [Chryseobacterium sp. Leaf394]
MEPKIEMREALKSEAGQIWEIIQQAIERRRQEGSSQWQNGYPNKDTIESDIAKHFGYVLTVDDEIAVYTALILNDEPAYSSIEGAWLSDGEFVVIHRVAVDEKFSGKGMVKFLFDKIEDFTRSQKIKSIKVDTNFDNLAMLRILESKGYSYCGEVMLAGGMRKAFEKIIF